MIKKPINEWQQRYNDLCQLGGGRDGGPATTKVQELLFAAGDDLNARLEIYAHAQFARLVSCNPWYIAFAIGLSWGHLAQETDEFTESCGQPNVRC